MTNDKKRTASIRLFTTEGIKAGSIIKIFGIPMTCLMVGVNQVIICDS